MSAPLTLAQLNDRFRRSLSGGEVFVTSGVTALPPAVQAELIGRVQRFDQFTEDNDPYGEHDFGSLDHPQAGRVFWKIDYYDPSKCYGSEDPLDDAKTCRVLTVMLAHEY